MLSKRDFVLLKMVFDETLYQAVESESLTKLNQCLSSKYSYELENGFVTEEELNEEDVKEIKEQFIEEAKHDGYEWAL